MTVPITHLLVPTDLSAASLAAATFAAGLARSLGATITLLHVIAAPNEMIGLAPGATVGEEVGAERTVALAQLAAIRAGLEAGGRLRVDTIVELATSPHDAIVDAAAAAQLVVMATHGRSAIGRVFLGSVAAAVLRDAHCPVLMIRPDHQA